MVRRRRWLAVVCADTGAEREQQYDYDRESRPESRAQHF
jgi:hypothetical protein